MDEEMREKLKGYIIFSKDVKTLDEIGELSITRIKGITKKEAGPLKSAYKVATIDDLSTIELTSRDLRYLECLGIKQTDILNWILLSKVLKSKDLENYIGPKKISLVGLNNAGKTALSRLFQNNVDINTFGKIKPTKGVERVILNSGNHEYVVWDMGGQENYREQYLKNGEKYFLNIELMIFVIDVHDKVNHNKAILFLKEILESLEFLQEKPNILVLIHKVDPDLNDNVEILEDINFLEKKINEVFKEKGFQYEVTTSSIYEHISKDPLIAKEMKEIITAEHEVKETVKDKELGESIEKTLNLMINLSASIESRLLNIEGTMTNVVQWVDYLRKTMPLKPPKAYSPPDADDKIVTKSLTIRDAVQSELKNILKMRKLGY